MLWSHSDLSPGAWQCRDVRGIDDQPEKAADESLSEVKLWEVG
jgi:hypothetical protein